MSKISCVIFPDEYRYEKIAFDIEKESYHMLFDFLSDLETVSDIYGILERFGATNIATYEKSDFDNGITMITKYE